MNPIGVSVQACSLSWMYHWWGTLVIDEAVRMKGRGHLLSVPSVQLCCEPKTVLKSKALVERGRGWGSNNVIQCTCIKASKKCLKKGKSIVLKKYKAVRAGWEISSAIESHGPN